LKEVTEILLIEDNQNDADLTIRAFKKFNLLNKVRVIMDGQEALDYITKEGENLKIIILDMNLPKINGLHILSSIKKNKDRKNIPVVVLTNLKDDHIVSSAYKLGANSFIVKPVDFQKFAEIVSALGFYWCMVNQPDLKKA
jgi:two-component system, response regulator